MSLASGSMVVEFENRVQTPLYAAKTGGASFDYVME